MEFRVQVQKLSYCIMKRIFTQLIILLVNQIIFLESKNRATLNCSDISGGDTFPTIRVSKYDTPNVLGYLNTNNYISNDTYVEIPSTLNFLELECTAPYPIQWGFQQYPYISWDISNERKEIKKEDSYEIQQEFVSRLIFSVLRESVLENKYPTCYSSSNKCLQTSINATATDRAVQLYIHRGTAFALNTKGKFGENKNCTLILNYDENAEKFFCQSIVGKKRPSLFIESCSDPVTCGALTTKTECNNTPKIAISNCTEANFCRNATLRVNYLPAVAVCLFPGMNTYSATMEYFYTFPINKTSEELPRDFRYFNWNDAPPKNMLEIRNLENKTVYAGEKFDISCNASYYYFASGLKFQIRDDYGSPSSNLKAVETVAKISATRGGTKIFLPFNRTLTLQEFFFGIPGNYNVTCLAPVWNSTDWISKSTKVTVLESLKPLLFDGNMTETLYYKPRKEIHCAAFGIPKPNITWTLDGQPLPSKISQVSGVQNETESWRNLLFPNSPTGIYGNFTCRAENVAGFDEKTFILLQNDSSSSTAIFVVAVIGVLAVVVGPLIIYLSWKIRQQRKQLQWMSPEEVDEFINGKPDYIPFKCDMNTYAYFLPYDKKLEIPRETLDIDWKITLGEGAYGIVYKGQVGDNSTSVKEVAVKTRKPIDLGLICFKALLSELKILSYIGKHDNIIKLEGACTDRLLKGEVLIVIEYCEHKSLLDFLKKHRHVYYNPVAEIDVLVAETSFINSNVQYVKMEDLTYIPLNNNSDENLESITFSDLLKWSRQIADGMEYLTSKKVIHGDLAARNVLLDSLKDAKISDFGLSKRLFNYATYTNAPVTKLPYKWLAIECLRDLECSVESDIWSYGVLLWEIFSLGEVPYSGMALSEIEFVEALCKGMRLSKPIHATSQIFEIMMSCWRYERKQRPGFALLSSFFKQSIELPMEYVHPTIMQRFSQDDITRNIVSYSNIPS